MIISASSRTDIPAFYGEWFLNRLNAGYCLSVNPFNGNVYRIGLGYDEVDGFVFWTKNLGPFLPRLAIVKERGFPFIVHYTINAYPCVLEPSVPPARTAVEHVKDVARAYGSRVCVWRYDPIIFTNITNYDFHRANFAQLCSSLAGAVDEVVVSYVSLAYRKTRRNLNRSVRRADFHFKDPEDDRKRDFLEELALIAGKEGVTLRLCGQPQYLSQNVPEAVCIDAKRLSDVAGRRIMGQKPGHRGQQCACDYSRDIGAYDTCLHGCKYCYAVSDPSLSRKVHKGHDPLAEWLCPPRRAVKAKPDGQLCMFCSNRQD